MQDSAGEDLLVLCDADGVPVGTAPRSRCHGEPSLMHKVVHIIVLDSAGRIFLQKRADWKDIQPGKWDTSVGGHVAPGETDIEAARRELKEELGIEGAELRFMYAYIMRSEVETEFVSSFCCVWNGPIRTDRNEIAEGRFWSVQQIESALGSGIFTPNFEDEFRRFREWFASQGSS